MGDDEDVLKQWDAHEKTGGSTVDEETVPALMGSPGGGGTAGSDDWAGETPPRTRGDVHDELDDQLNPKRNALHRFFNFIRFITIFSASNMLLGQFIGIAFDAVGPIQYVLRIYVILLCCLTILNELEWTNLTLSSALLKIWISRGLIYGFVGVLGLEENDVSPHTKNMSMVGRTAALNYIKVVAWMMVACGILYTVMGILCLQIVSDKIRENYQGRVARAAELRRTGLFESSNP
mmetsp:Transcript_12655/g.17960  ORF Transcript_12655/g.17960 Transcript_12655/m.17960 type:complete len:235 (+) Transcript_12655:2897-3601(+)